MNHDKPERGGDNWTAPRERDPQGAGAQSRRDIAAKRARIQDVMRSRRSKRRGSRTK